VNDPAKGYAYFGESSVNGLKPSWLDVGIAWSFHLVEEPAEPTTPIYQARSGSMLVAPKVDGTTATIDQRHIVSETVLPTFT